ncbi:hypothetical protein CNR37_00099 [Pseudomonas phage ventosus]|uniref:Uncharacterized protein n=1 Tax=Pseudomonas phage ventosus TaxID=2048980 RepID=A0A2H4P801_9CAUD|nr:hypothetical protein CNR37_00099 [Pseudomonas phage ventosus]
MRQLKVSDFANAREYEQAKREQRRASQTKRQSPNGRGKFEFQPVAPAVGTEE